VASLRSNESFQSPPGNRQGPPDKSKKKLQHEKWGKLKMNIFSLSFVAVVILMAEAQQ
jgi:hypothetical protein